LRRFPVLSERGGGRGGESSHVKRRELLLGTGVQSAPPYKEEGGVTSFGQGRGKTTSLLQPSTRGNEEGAFT